MTHDSTVTIESASPPYVECIHWLPRKLASGAAAGTSVDVVIDQYALQQMKAHARSAPDVSVGGLLIGRVFRDPTCSRAWVKVEAAERVAAPFSDDPSAAELGRSLSPLPVPAGQVAIGWYRTHPRTGLYLSEGEAEYHRTSFPDAWHCAVILLGEEERTTGGVFQRTERGLSRSAYAPFYELIDPSSELGSRTYRTFSGWTSYETQTSVVPAGRNGVSAELPRPARAEAPETPSREDPPASPPVTLPDAGPSAASPSPVASSGAPAAGRPDGGSAGSDEAWSKLQIQRSLTAVGRTLTPSALGQLGAPASVVDPARLEEDAAEGGSPVGPTRAPAETGPPARASEPTGVPSAAEPGPVVQASEPRTMAAEPPPDAPPKAPTAATPAREGAGALVGRSRRRPRRPPRQLAFAAAVLLVMASGVWVGLQIAGPTPAAPEEDTGHTDLAPARLGIGDQPLFGERGGAVGSAADPGIPADPDAPAGPVAPPDLVGPVDPDAGNPAPEVEGTGDPPRESVSGVESAAGADEGGRAPEAAAGAGSPDPLPLVIDDPAVAAYEDALQIFGKEADRYDEARRAFDDGLQGCNPLNLALRGVRESFERLSERFEQARGFFAGPGLRAFESAERQAAVIQRHYELTDCPPPIGG